MEISIKNYNKELLKVFNTDVEKQKEVVITTTSDIQKVAEIELYINSKRYRKYLIKGLLPTKAGFLNITLNFELDDNILIFSYLDKNGEIIKHFINLKLLKAKRALLLFLPFSPLILLLPLLLFFGINFYRHFWNNKDLIIEESTNIQDDTVQNKEINELQMPEEESIETEEKNAVAADNSNNIIVEEKIYTVDTLKDFISENSPLYFVKNKSVLLDGEINKLDKIVEYFKNYSTTNLLIEGHTDSIGIPENEYNLSLERAEYIKKFLESRVPDISFEIEIKGYGATNLVTPPGDKSNKYLNRRVEINITSAEGKS